MYPEENLVLRFKQPIIITFEAGVSRAGGRQADGRPRSETLGTLEPVL
jgi:hypothetical protein